MGNKFKKVIRDASINLESEENFIILRRIIV